MVRQAHHPEPSRRANYNDRNLNLDSAAFDMLRARARRGELVADQLFWSLNIGICDLPFDWLRVVSLSNHLYFGACYLGFKEHFTMQASVIKIS
jgi:hypothetical protein